jgi:nucleotide-binding universal stress UspA family protein
MTILESKLDPAEPHSGSAPASVEAPISLRNVLYATDFSATSEAALPYAAAIARKFGSTLHGAHVVSDTSLLLMTGGVDYVSFNTLYEDAHTIAKERVQELTERLGRIPNRGYVRHGKVWESLSGIVAENAVDLIVIGTHGRTGLEKVLIGSVAEDILRHAPCPVLTVGPKICGRARLPEFETGRASQAPVELELQRILFAATFSPGSRQVAAIAVWLCEKFLAQLALIHVLENSSNPDLPTGPMEKSLRMLRNLVPPDAGLAYTPEIMVESGSAWRCIVKKAAECDADLIVLGAHPKDHTTHLPWSTVHQVVAHANCPVLTVRTAAR